METRRLSSYLFAAVTALEACGGSNAALVQPRDSSVAVSAEPDGVFTPDKRDEAECRAIVRSRQNIMACCINFDDRDTPDQPICWQGTPEEMEKRHSHNLLILPNGEQVVGYPPIKDQVPEARYVEYLMRRLITPEDVVHLIDQIITYTQDNDNLLYPALETLRNGSGDCDNMSNLAKFLLTELGKRNGYDYQPRIITLHGSNHAVLVFKDKDNQWKSLDQHPPLTVIPDNEGQIDLFAASEIFVKKDGENEFREVVQLDNEKRGRGASLSFGVDASKLVPDRSFMASYTTRHYDEKQDPSAIDPSDYVDSELARGADWRKIEDLQLQFGDATVFYKSGVIVQFQHNNELWAYEGGHLVQKEYLNSSSSVEKEFFDAVTGLLLQRHHRNGTFDFFRSGKLFQKQYKTGDVDAETFSESGILIQRNFRDGHVEWYDSEGKIIQKRDKSGRTERIQ